MDTARVTGGYMISLCFRPRRRTENTRFYVAFQSLLVTSYTTLGAVLMRCNRCNNHINDKMPCWRLAWRAFHLCRVQNVRTSNQRYSALNVREKYH